MPMLITMPKSKLKATGKDQRNPILSVIKTVKGVAQYVFIEVDAGLPSRCISPWHYDCGTEVSQISLQASRNLRSALRPVGSGKIECTTAFGKQRIDMQLCSMRNVRLIGNSYGNKSRTMSTHVFVNPKLRSMTCIFGLNSMFDFGAKRDIVCGTIESFGGEPIFMLIPVQVKMWLEDQQTKKSKRLVLWTASVVRTFTPTLTLALTFTPTLILALALTPNLALTFTTAKTTVK